MPETSLPSSQTVNQLVLVVVTDEQAGELGKALVAEGFRFTMISASSGLLPVGTSCLMLGISGSDAARLEGVVATVCTPRRRFIPTQGPFSGIEGLPLALIEAEVGSASIYRLDVDYYEVV